MFESSVPVHPGLRHWGRPPQTEVAESRATGRPASVGHWRMVTHTDTRIDALARFIDGGGGGIAERWRGEAGVRGMAALPAPALGARAVPPRTIST